MSGNSALPILANPVALIGFMGSGKSSVGRCLARLTGFAFIDTDESISTQAGAPITELFQSEGEAAFRDREARIFARTIADSTHSRAIISTGGGIVLRPENRHALRCKCQAVWLTTRVDVLVERLKAEAASRPLIASRTPESLRSHILSMLAERAPLYHEAAHLIVDSSDRTPEAIAREIARKLSLPMEPRQ